MPAPVYLVNTGIITAIGGDTAACLQSLRSSRHGIGKAQILKSHWQDEIPVGEITETNAALAAKTAAPEDWPRTALLSAIAASEAWNPFSEIRSQFSTGFFSANTVGGMDRTEAFYPGYLNDKAAGSASGFIHHECGIVTRLVANHLGFKGYTTTISTACSSSANSIMLAAQMIRAGLLDVAVAGGADALSRFTLNGFNTLGILDRQLCQPFDVNRRGLNMGEGAGYVVLMSDAAIKHFEAAPMALLSGWGNANDAYHQTASSPDGIGNILAMKAALQTAGLRPGDISYINLHGTGTDNNDGSEGKAVQELFGDPVPPASSTKAFTGHTLGAAGGVEAVFSALAIRERLLFPNLRFEQRIPDLNFEPVLQLQENVAVRNVLSNSFGFGGACSSLILSAC